MVTKRESKIDVAVLLIFFCREKPFSKVFAAIKEARPSRLYLYQDGAREGRQDDIEGCKKCRQIAEDIDWECEVHRFYQEKNVGCDPSEYIAQKWMFESEEMGIVIEDDDVPSQSFFPFCKELLERYKDDLRINMICGMNNTDVSKHCNDSYFFTNKGSICGWASWRRVLDTWDPEYKFLDDPVTLKRLQDNSDSKEEYKKFINTCIRHKASGRAHYESINGAARRLYGRINIVPKYNMISNIGIDAVTTHGANDIRKLPKRIQKIFFKKTYEIDFPLKHPQYVIRDKQFEREMTFTRKQNFFNKIEAGIRKIIYR